MNVQEILNIINETQKPVVLSNDDTEVEIRFNGNSYYVTCRVSGGETSYPVRNEIGIVDRLDRWLSKGLTLIYPIIKVEPETVFEQPSVKNSPARNQFLQDCAAANIAPSVAAAELRSKKSVKLSHDLNGDYVTVIWDYSPFLEMFYRGCQKMSDATFSGIKYDLNGEVIQAF